LTYLAEITDSAVVATTCDNRDAHRAKFEELLVDVLDVLRRRNLVLLARRIGRPCRLQALMALAPREAHGNNVDVGGVDVAPAKKILGELVHPAVGGDWG